MASEELWRAALHDFNNLMAGLQGVLDLSDPSLPLDARNRLRLEGALEDGKTLIAMSRALALGRLPDSGLASWREWQSGLVERLGTLSLLFRCPVEVASRDAENGPWPAPLLQDWAAAFTRQILPWAAPGPLRIEATATAEAWVLRWLTDAPLPLALRPDAPVEAARNVASLWLRAMSEQLGLSLTEGVGALEVRLSRPVQ
jgi:hypothetical protein